MTRALFMLSDMRFVISDLEDKICNTTKQEENAFRELADKYRLIECNMSSSNV